MASVNKVTLIGNLGRDPETRTFPDGGQIANVAMLAAQDEDDTPEMFEEDATA